MSTTMTNGRMHNGQHQPRKQLSDQIDRLDILVDGLADELPNAVADVTREGTRQAVCEVLKEILSDPATIAQFRNLFVAPTPAASAMTNPTLPVAPTLPSETKLGVFARWKSKIQDKAKTTFLRMKQSFARLRNKIREMKTQISAAATTVRNILPVGRYLLIALGIGTTVAGVCYVAPPEISAVVSGVCGAVVAMTVQLFRWIRRSAKNLILLK